jgi:hypothetical protein
VIKRWVVYLYFNTPCGEAPTSLEHAIEVGNNFTLTQLRFELMTSSFDIILIYMLQVIQPKGLKW